MQNALADIGTCAGDDVQGTEAAPARLTIAVGIATVGRRAAVARTVAELRFQTRAPDVIVVCAPEARDVAGLDCDAPNVRVLISPQGSSHQRNAILRDLEGFDVILFMDDDFILCPTYIETTERVFLAHPDIVVATGNVVVDGIRGPGLDFDTARDIANAPPPDRSDFVQMDDVYSGYGCNMAVRLEPVARNGIVFDEQLPLYAWLEDVDFSRQLARHGRLVRVSTMRGVHLGIKVGRSPGMRLGYSQIANPLYLIRKGTCSWRKALFLMVRNMAANLVRSLHPEPYIDRKGRVRGNARALYDLVAGRLSPSRILSF
ncbi:MAG: glycosyltransferase [Bacteroidales bacterium]|nr:glycosyltransferase [Bacteroidales bacterium]